MPPQKEHTAALRSLERFIKKIDDKDSALIKVLYEAQHLFGYLPKDVVFFIADKLNVPAAKIFGVISFYSYFSTEPKSRCQIKLCMGTACFVCGAEKLSRQFEQELGIKMGESTADREFSLGALRCVGACGLAPVAVVNEKVCGRLDLNDVSKIISDNRA